MEHLECGESGIVICTNKYAGNFERALAGFVFGAIDEYWNSREIDPYQEEIEEFESKYHTGELVCSTHPDFFRPAQICNYKGNTGYNDIVVRVDCSFAKYINEWENAVEELEVIKERIKRFCNLFDIELKGVYWITVPNTYISDKII